MSYVSQGLISQVSSGVSQTTMTDISSLHNNIRALLPNYETFLQGSYANDTAISDINDVDIVAVHNPLMSLLTGSSQPSNLFYDIKNKLEANQNYMGMVTIGHKCLTVNLNTKQADIVPAIRSTAVQLNQYREPLIIAQSIRNYPKTHLANGQAKNQRTNNNYKKLVRMLKNYVNNWNLKNIAPSFYIECLVYSYTDNSFGNDLAYSLNNILSHMVGQSFVSTFTTVAGDKIVISQNEWSPQSFIAFRQHIANKLPQLNAAARATSETLANSYFRQFFNI